MINTLAQVDINLRGLEVFSPSFISSLNICVLRLERSEEIFFHPPPGWKEGGKVQLRACLRSD